MSNVQQGDTVDKEQLAKLLLALEQGDLRFIQTLHDSEPLALIDPLCDNGSYAYHVASLYGHIDIIQFLLLKLPRLYLELTNHLGETPLYCAAKRGQARLVQYYVTQGAKLTTAINAPHMPNDGMTALLCAIERNHSGVVNILIQAGGFDAMAIAKRPEWGVMAYEWAMLNNNDVLIRLILNMALVTQGLVLFAAIKSRSIPVVKHLISRHRNLLMIMDEQGMPPIYWAVCEGSTELVSWFIEQGVDVTQQFADQDNVYENLVDLATDRGEYLTANLIINTILKAHGPETAFYLINQVEMLFEYILLNPANTHLVLGNERLMSLLERIDAPNVVVSSQSIGYYKTAGRRPSFFADVDRETGVATLFHPAQTLGNGASGLVRKFVSASGQSMAVKSPIEPYTHVFTHADLARVSEIREEAQFLKTAFGCHGTALGHAFFFEKQKSKLTHRIIMPCVEGINAVEFLKKITHFKTLIELMLAMTKALIRLHERGIIHGDIKLDNILISNQSNVLEATFIDFGWSYYNLWDNEALLTDEYQATHWAPERRQYNICLLSQEKFDSASHVCDDIAPGTFYFTAKGTVRGEYLVKCFNRVISKGNITLDDVQVHRDSSDDIAVNDRLINILSLKASEILEITGKRGHTRPYQNTLVPNTNQDIFSFGYLLQDIVNEVPRVSSKWPFIKRFIDEALDVVPNNRPTLPVFYEQLSDVLDRDNYVHVEYDSGVSAVDAANAAGMDM